MQRHEAGARRAQLPLGPGRQRVVDPGDVGGVQRRHERVAQGEHVGAARGEGARREELAAAGGEGGPRAGAQVGRGHRGGR